MFDVALDWTHCPDGVVIHDYGLDDAPTRKHSIRNEPFALEPKQGPHFRPRTDRRVPMRIEAVDLERPLLLRFVNTKDAGGLANLFGRFGMPTAAEEEPVPAMMDLQASFAGYVDVCMSLSTGEKATVMNSLFAKMKLKPEFDYSDAVQKGRVALYADNIMQFMSAELAVAVLSDVKLVYCANCGEAFFTGPAAKRRADAKTCSNRCRVALMRKKDG